MRRSPSKVDIYVISLDTFMLLAVLGITIGILFIIISPMLNYEKVGVAQIKDKFTCTKMEFNQIINETDFIIEVDDDFIPLNYFLPEDTPIQRYYNTSYRGVNNTKLIGQIRALNDTTRHYLDLWVTVENDQEYRVEILGFGAGYNQISVEDMSLFIGEEMRYWPELSKLSQ